MSPLTRTPRRPARCDSTGSHRSRGTPQRRTPVSSFTCTSTWWSRAAAARASAPSRLHTTGVSPASTTSRAAAAGGSISSSTGAVIPAARSASPSSTSATPSHTAPASSAALATGTAPCP